MRAVIVGGGIGGLTTALCLERRGWDVCVLEQAERIAEVGAGIQISPNGMKVLAQLGLAEAIAERAFRPEAIEMRIGHSGRQVFSLPLAERAVSRWGAPYLHIHRADLIAVLLDALRQRAPAAMRTNACLTSYTQSGELVTAQLASGDTVTGKLLVGADGMHSRVRSQMLGEDEPRFTGHVAWRAVVPVEALGDQVPPPSACIWVGRGRHAVTYLLRGGELANFVGVVKRADWRAESWSGTGARAEVQADFANWHPVVTRLIAMAPELHRWALFDRPPLNQWVDGHALLLGDACHPMLPFMAQGAAMAIEDAEVLAQALESGTEIATSLITYYRARRRRTARVQSAARRNANTFHRPMPVYGLLWALLKLRPDLYHKRWDWLYGKDVVSR